MYQMNKRKIELEESVNKFQPRKKRNFQYENGIKEENKKNLPQKENESFNDNLSHKEILNAISSNIPKKPSKYSEKQKIDNTTNGKSNAVQLKDQSKNSNISNKNSTQFSQIINTVNSESKNINVNEDQTSVQHQSSVQIFPSTENLINQLDPPLTENITEQSYQILNTSTENLIVQPNLVICPSSTVQPGQTNSGKIKFQNLSQSAKNNNIININQSTQSSLSKSGIYPPSMKHRQEEDYPYRDIAKRHELGENNISKESVLFLDPFDAAYKGNLDMLKLWLENTPTASLSIRNKSRNHSTLLYTAAGAGQLNVVQWLIEKCVDLNETQGLGSSALHGAAFYGHVQVCELLVESNAAVDILNKYDELPIDNAIQSKSDKIIILLSKEHIKIQKPPEIFILPTYSSHKTFLEKWARGEKTERGWSKRHWIKEFSIDPIKLAFSYVFSGDLKNFIKWYENTPNASLDARDLEHNKATFLYTASAHGHLDIVNWLISKNCDVNVTQATNSTPLHGAAFNGHSEVCRLLIESNANMDAKNMYGETPFDNAKKIRDVVDVFNSYKPLTPDDVFNAISKNKIGTLAKWVSNNGSINIVNNNNATLLHVAVSMENRELVDVLIKQNINVNSQQDDGATPLHLAALSGNTELVKLLTQHNARTDIITINNEFPLDYARKSGQLQTFMELDQDELELITPGQYQTINFDYVPVMEKHNLIKTFGNEQYKHIIGPSGEKYAKVHAKLLKKSVKVDYMVELKRVESHFKEIILPKFSFVHNDIVKRENISVKGARCFLIHGILTSDECVHFIQETEKVNYESLNDKFNPNYRNNERILFKSEELADCLWERMSPMFEREDVFRIRPIGFGNKGTWKPYRLNECFKFGKYEPSGHFKPHMDGPWVPRNDESSVYTVVIYLNDNFEGGETRFLGMNSTALDVKVSPKEGTALIFNHDVLHEGLSVVSGVKYIIRTEVMFRRVDTEQLVGTTDYEDNDNYLRTIKLYHKSQKAEREGDIPKFTEAYLEALKLQVEEQRSLGPDHEEISYLEFPIEVWVNIFQNFSATQICKLFTVSKIWFDILRDGIIWLNKYKEKWPFLTALESKIPTNTKSHPSIVDWFGAYWGRYWLTLDMKPVVLDFGSYKVKGGMCHKHNINTKFPQIESVVTKLVDIHDFHGRRSQWTRYYSGSFARKQFPNHIIRVIKEGRIIDHTLLPEIITGIFYSLHIRPFHHPIIIAEPAFGWTPFEKKKLNQIMLDIFRVPSFCFVNSACLVLYSLHLDSGVVVSFGYEVGCISLVLHGVQLSFDTFNPKENTLDNVAIITKNLIGKITSEENRKILCSHITYSGGRTFEDVDFFEHFKTAIQNNITEFHCTVICNTEPVNDIVIGGCYLGMLRKFRSLIAVEENTDSNRLTPFHPQSTEGNQDLEFYNIVVYTNYYWFRGKNHVEISQD